MQIRRVKGLENLLKSLSLGEGPGKTHHVVYPWHEYSKVPGQDLGFWYSAEQCQYGTLRRLILQRFKEIGHPNTDRLADGLVLAFVLMPKTGDVMTEFEKLLSSLTDADVSQFLLIPASALLQYVREGQPAKHDIIGFFGHGSFRYAPFVDDLMEAVKDRFRRIGQSDLPPEFDKKCWGVSPSIGSLSARRLSTLLNSDSRVTNRRALSHWCRTTLMTSLIGTGTIGVANQGRSVALADDGNTVLVGGYSDDDFVGAVWVFVGTGPSITSGGVVNGAGFLPGIAPGTWITIQGANLSATTRTWNGADFSGSNLPTQLDGVSVTVNGKPAYVYFISPTQLNVLAPEDATLSPVPIQVTTAQAKSNVVNAIEAGFSAALFTFGAQGRNYVAAVRADGPYIGPTVPAKPGETILLYGTGFGPTAPPGPIGQLITPAPLASQVTVRIGGIAADTQFAGIVSPGLYQFNVTVPGVPNGDNAVWVEIGGGISQSNAFLTVQR